MASTKPNQYSPTSHFFVEHLALADANIANEGTDAFGLLNGNSTTQYCFSPLGKLKRGLWLLGKNNFELNSL